MGKHSAALARSGAHSVRTGRRRSENAGPAAAARIPAALPLSARIADFGPHGNEGARDALPASPARYWKRAARDRADPPGAADPTAMNIALIAHDKMKSEIVELATEFRDTLARHTLMATGTTGGRLRDGTGLDVECLLSGPQGGDLQIGARLSMGMVAMVIFLRDPMTPQPHEPDINALVRACDVHNVACATNRSTARLLLKSLG